MPAIAKKGILYTETPSVENRVVEGNQNPVTSGAVYKELGDTSVNNDLGANVSNQIGNLHTQMQTKVNNAGFHNAVFKGNSLGTSVSDNQWAEIKAGTFEDMYIGDYWTINNVVYRIAAFDWWLHYGATELKSHHVVLVPDGQLYTAQMNTSNTTSGAYWNSAMKQSNLATALTTVQTAFGLAHILTRSALMPTASSGDNVTGWEWQNTSIDLMTERMVYGNAAWGQTAHNGYDAGTDYNQLPLFRLASEFIIARDASGNRQWWWLRDVQSSTRFADVNIPGDAHYDGASLWGGVRPAFLIG